MKNLKKKQEFYCGELHLYRGFLAASFHYFDSTLS
jgi:hypothetical protein